MISVLYYDVFLSYHMIIINQAQQLMRCHVMIVSTY